MKFVSFSILGLLSILPHTTSVRETFNKISSDVYGLLLTKSFGMASRGLVKIKYEISATNDTAPYESYVVILILNEMQRTSWYNGLDKDVSSNSIASYCSQPSLVRKLVYGSDTIFYEIDSSLGSDQYSVAVLQCLSSLENNPVSVHVHATMKNVRPESDTEYSELSIEEVLYPRILEGETIVYSLLIAGLLGQIYLAKDFATPLHFLFLFTLVSTLCVVFAEYYDFYYYNVHGHDVSSNVLAINILAVFSDTAQLSSLLLLSMGWSFVRASLPEKEQRMFMWAMSSFFAVSLGAAGCLDREALTCSSLSLLAFVIKTILLLGIIIAMNFTVTQLRAMLNHSPWVPSTPLQYARYQQFQVFRLIFLLYILLPTAFSLVQITMYSWRENWLVFLLNESLTIFMCFHLGVNFSPLYETLMTRPFDGTLANTGGSGVGVGRAD